MAAPPVVEQIREVIETIDRDPALFRWAIPVRPLSTRPIFRTLRPSCLVL
jgi:hypothetical protein